MTEELALLLRTARVLNDAGTAYFVTGSVAAMRYGEPRMTRDIDIVVHLRYGDIPVLLAAFPEPEFYLSKDAMWMRCGTTGSSTSSTWRRA